MAAKAVESARRIRGLSTAAGCALVLGIGGCGGSAASRSATSSASQSSTSSAAPQPAELPAATARHLTASCRRAETSEDANIVLSFANKGGSILAPPETATMRVAARHITAEAAAIRAVLRRSPASAAALGQAMASEASVLDRTSRLVELRTAEQRLLASLHQRIALSRHLGIPRCAGVSPISALRTTAPPS